MRAFNFCCGLLLASLGWGHGGLVAAQPVSASDLALGERIYQRGMLTDQQPLRAAYAQGAPVIGRDAACVSCHRPSGLGSVEGDVVIPPITGRALFGQGEPLTVRADRRFEPGLAAKHTAYDEASLATTLRLGRDINGRDLHALMPRYQFTDEQVRALAAYLRSLSVRWSPGVSDSHIRMATVLTPDLAPERRQAFLNTLNTLVSQININIHSGQRQKVSAIERRVQARRQWTLDVWELNGPPESWPQQLVERQRQAPVFALLSGLGGVQWQPVHDFCEQQQVVCWFPSVDIPPPNAASGQFNLYFADRVGTEAQVLARRVNGGRVLQWVADDPLARHGAAQLRRSLGQRGAGAPSVVDADLPTDAVAAARALATLTPEDHLVLWLCETDLRLLRQVPAPAAAVLASASLMGSDEPSLPPDWRRNFSLAQSLEVANLRAANLERFHAWLSGSRVALVDARMQSEVYFAARAMLFTLRSMLTNFHTPYLIERAETTISMFETMQVQEEIQAAMMAPVNKRPVTAQPAPDPALAERQRARLEEMRQRGGTTAYPRLSLAAGQRVASKGAYLGRLNPGDPGFAERPELFQP